MRMQVWSLALLSGLRIWHCHEPWNSLQRRLRVQCCLCCGGDWQLQLWLDSLVQSSIRCCEAIEKKKKKEKKRKGRCERDKCLLQNTKWNKNNTCYLLLPRPRWLASPELLGRRGSLYASRKGSAGGPSWQAATRTRVPAWECSGEMRAWRASRPPVTEACPPHQAQHAPVGVEGTAGSRPCPGPGAGHPARAAGAGVPGSAGGPPEPLAGYAAGAGGPGDDGHGLCGIPLWQGYAAHLRGGRAPELHYTDAHDAGCPPGSALRWGDPHHPPGHASGLVQVPWGEAAAGWSQHHGPSAGGHHAGLHPGGDRQAWPAGRHPLQQRPIHPQVLCLPVTPVPQL